MVFGNKPTSLFSSQAKIVYLPKQSCCLQGWISILGPISEQSLPPWSGDGLVQERVRVVVPSPQVAEQAVQLDQCV